MAPGARPPVPAKAHGEWRDSPLPAGGVQGVPPVATPGSRSLKTRDLLNRVIHRQRFLWKLATVVTASAALLFGVALWRESNKSNRLPTVAQDVHRQLVHSTVWIINRNIVPGELIQGSGALIDAKRCLILTNYHVVAGTDEVEIYTPIVRDAIVVAEKAEYLPAVERAQGARGRVVARDKLHDLALVQVDALWEGAKALALATEGAQPGQRVHSLGNPGSSDALWVYTSGMVRQVYFKEWTVEGLGLVLDIQAHVVETQSPVNPGDSGGPLVNDRGDLLGVTQGGDATGQLMSLFIDKREVETLLREYHD
jgi:S1-C subfamily serine protease